MFDAIYHFLCENQLFTFNQSGFHPGDSTINQLLSITHKIYSVFDEFHSRETRAVFLDISKAFDKVWHDGLLFKLKSYGISIYCLFTVIKENPSATHQVTPYPVTFLCLPEQHFHSLAPTDRPNSS